MNHAQTAIAMSFKLFEAAYGARWKAPSIELWELMLDGVQPAEIAQAARSWCTAQPPKPFPPSPAELKALLPRFCTCRHCHHCNARAIAAHKRALERGSIGHEPETPIHSLINAALQPKLLEP